MQTLGSTELAFLLAAQALNNKIFTGFSRLALAL